MVAYRSGSSSLRTPALLIGLGFLVFVCYTTLFPGRSATTNTANTILTTAYSRFLTTDTDTMATTPDNNNNNNKVDIDVSSALAVSARQTGTSPPRITFSVTNNSPQALTVLTWDTPLDPLALQLGRVTISILPSSSSSSEAQPLGLPIIQIRRKMPPDGDALVTIEPGGTAENEVVLREALVPPERLREAAGRLVAVARGRWAAVWPGAAADVTEEERGDMGAGRRALAGSYESEPLEIKVDAEL